MRALLLLYALALAGCAHDPAGAAPAQATTPTGPCRDDENFVNGKCEPRIPGDRRPPGGIPPWTRP